MPHFPEHIIISRTDNIGDVILTLPLAGYLKRYFPTTHISFIAQAYLRNILANCQFVDRSISREELLAKKVGFGRIKEAAIIFVYPDSALARLAQQSRLPIRIGTSHRLFHWLYLNRRINFTRKYARLHEAQLNFKLLQGLGIAQQPTLQEIVNYYGLLPPKPSTTTAKLTRPHKFKCIIHPKSRGSAREWPLQHYVDLVQGLQNKPFHFFVTGTASEKILIQQQCPQLLTLPQTTDVMAHFSLGEFIAFIGLIDGIVACSTGPLHIAAALNKYALGIFPPMKPLDPIRWQPVGNNAHVFCVPKKNCTACRKNTVCACINQISPRQVADYLTSCATEVVL